MGITPATRSPLLDTLWLRLSALSLLVSGLSVSLQRAQPLELSLLLPLRDPVVEFLV